MRTPVVAAVAGLLAVACSSSDKGPSCDYLPGSWRVNSVRFDGDCDQSKFGSQQLAVSIRARGNGVYEILIPGVTGGCPADLDRSTCHLSSTCDATDSMGAKLSSSVIDWDVDGATFTGTTLVRVQPNATIGVTASCAANYRDKGTKL